MSPIPSPSVLRPIRIFGVVLRSDVTFRGAYVGRLTGYDCQEVSGIQDDDALVALNGQQVLIPGHQIVSASPRRTSEEVVIIGVATYTGGRSLGKEKGIQAKELEERLSVSGIDSVFLLDLGAAQDLCHLVDLPGNQEKQECAPAPCVD